MLALFTISTSWAFAEFRLSDQGSPVYYTHAIAAGEGVQVEGRSQVFGDVHSNGEMTLGGAARIDGDVSVVGRLRGGGTVDGETTEGAPALALPVLLPEPELRALADRIVEGDVTFTDEVIDDVVFVAGNVLVEGSFDGTGTLIATGEVALAGESKPGSLILAETTRLSLISLGDVSFGPRRPFRGVVRGGGDVQLNPGATFEGVIVADATARVLGDSTFTFVKFDQTPPALEIIAPTGTVTGDTTPAVVAGFSDEFSGLDFASLRVTLDDLDLTAGCEVTATGATCEPPELDEGEHTVSVTLRDLAGNEAVASSTFDLVLDAFPPTITFTAPAEGARLLNDLAPTLRLEYTDDSSGVDPATLRVRRGSDDFTSSCAVGPASAVCEPPPLGAGLQVLEARVRDRIGNLGTASLAFAIFVDTEPPTVTILSPAATPVIGDATPGIAVGFSDVDSGADPGTLRVFVDALELTESCEVGESQALCTPPVLAEGPHTVRAEIADLAGLAAEALFTFDLQLDEVPPSLAIVSPEPPTVHLRGIPLVLEAAYSDDDLGVDLESFQLLVDGDARLSSDCSVGSTQALCNLPLAAGAHLLEVTVADRAGNVTTASVEVSLVLDPTAPTLVITSPAAPSVEASPAIAVEYADADSAVDVGTLRIRVDNANLTAGCSVGTSAASCPAPVLGEGIHTVRAEVGDLAGNVGRAELTFDLALRDRTPPELEILHPPELIIGESAPRIEIRWADASAVDPTTLFVGLDEVGITDLCQADAAGAECQPALLAAGTHALRVEVHDTEGNVARADRIFELELQLPVEITEPTPGVLTSAATVTVRGVVSELADAVTVAEVAAVIDGGTFVAEDVPVSEGANVLAAVATSDAGGVGTATTNVVRDTLAPRVVIFSPRDGLVTARAQILVTGEVHDPSSSNSEVTAPRVFVNGVEAEVEQRAFFVPDLLLQPGKNTIRAEATDPAGNVRATEVTVTFTASTVLNLEEILGNGQTAAVGETLADPLMVRLSNFQGLPLAGRPVIFEVTRGAGEVSSFPDQSRRLQVLTDENGLAEARFQLGARSGRGNHEVSVTTLGVAGAVVFCASAETGVPQRVKRIVGSNQSGAQAAVADAPAPYPLFSQVFDAAGNPVPGVEVTYTVEEGGGHFDGEPFFVTTTDSFGKASAVFTLGPLPGLNNNLVEAGFEGLSELPARFFFSGVVPSEDGTRISGLVLDNEDQPVPGATLRVAGTELSSVSDALGRFTISGAPVGAVHLEADGSTVTRPGTWPTLTFDLTTIPGHDNTLGQPIRLLPLAVETTRTVGGAEDVTLTLPGVEGMEVTVFANSVTFPDGSGTGELSLTQVHGDKVPMVAPLGSDFLLAWTVQPPGVLFDPPARVAIPNLGGEPGSVIDIFSFDHDLGEFIPVGTAAVTEDGLQLVSTAGSGIVKSGWHGCLPPPPPEGDACNPSACKVCDADGRLKPKCSKCEKCNSGSCTPRKLEKVTIKAEGKDKEEIVVAKKQDVEFRAEVKGDCSPREFKWTFGDSQDGSGVSPTHAYEEKGTFTVNLTVSCKDCPGAGTVTDEIRIRVIELDLELDGLMEESEPSPNEEDPGAFIVSNNDDDNDNETPDRDESDSVDNEDDLVELSIELDRDIEEGELRLETSGGAGALRVWEEETKGTEVELPKTWTLGEDDIPETLWVEGTGAALEADLMLVFESETLEEPVEDKVVVTVVDLEFEVLPAELYEISADEPEIEVVASVAYKDFDDPEKLIPVEEGAEVEWQVTEGGGSLDDPTSTTDENGLAATTLQAPSTAGAMIKVEGTLRRFRLKDAPEDQEIETEQTSESGPMEVIPGLPSVIDVTSGVGGYASDEKATAALTAQVRDKSGNPVKDGTPVSWLLLGESTTEYRQTVTTVNGGTASAVLEAPQLPIDQQVEVRAGEALGTRTLNVRPVTGGITASASSLDVTAGETATLTLSVDAADGSTLFWSTSNGSVLSGASIVDGTATVVLSTAGGSTGPVVVTASVGSSIFSWSGQFVSSAPLWGFPENRFLVVDSTTDGFLTRRKDGLGTKAVPFFASTQVELHGPAGALAAVAVPGTRNIEAYTFENEVAGVVPGLVAGHDMVLQGAVLDGSVASSGASSLRFDPGAAAEVAHAEDFDFPDGFGVSFVVRPSQIVGAELMAKGGAWSIRLDPDGTVQASVTTETGTHQVASQGVLLVDAWNRIELEAVSGSLRLRAGIVEAVNTDFTGTVETNQEPIRLGGGFLGHLDDLAFVVPSTAFFPFALEGVGAGGLVRLDENGSATITMRSRGTASLPLFQAEPCLLGLNLLGEEASQLKSRGLAGLARKAEGDEEEITVWGLSIETWDTITDVVSSFFGGDPQSTAGIVANVAGGVLIVGDVGAIVKNLWRLAGFSEKDPNYPELVLSTLGLITEFAVGAGEIADVPISFARAIVARIGNSPLARILAKRLKDVITKGKAITRAEISLLEQLKNSDSLLTNFNRFIKSDDAWEGAIKVCEKFGDLPVPVAAAPSEDEGTIVAKGAAHTAVLKAIGDLAGQIGEETAKRAQSVIKGLDTKTVNNLRNADNLEGAVKNLGKVVGKVDPEEMVRVLNNTNLVTPNYNQVRLLEDLSKVADVDGLPRLVANMKAENIQVLGTRYELEVAVDFLGQGKKVQFLSKPSKIEGQTFSTDIDIIADGIAYQVKRSAEAIGYGKKGLESAKQWVKAALKEVGGDPSRIKYVVPPNTAVPPQVGKFLDDFKPTRIDFLEVDFTL